MRSEKAIVMLGTSFDTMGGISAVFNEYRRAGLFERFPILYLATHADGDMLGKLRMCASAWARHAGMLLGKKVALVHVHVASDASFWRKSLFLFPTYLCGVPTIVHLHGAEFSRFYERDCGPAARWVVRRVFERADRVVVLSDAWQDWLSQVVRGAHIRSINNPVQVPPLAGFTQREPATVLCLGRLGKRKGTYDLLHAVSRLLPRHPGLTLLLGGDGEQEQVRAEAERLGMSARVEVLGWVGPEHKAALLRRAALYALPSYAEGLPMSVLEAMAAGLPIVSTPVGGIPEIIDDGIEGMLVEPGDVAALANAIDVLLRDAERRRQMGVAAYRRAESTFSAARIVPRIEGLYRELGVNA